MPIILDGTTGITTPGITNTGTFVFQGPIQVPAGTAASPSVTTASGGHTGLYFPSSSSVALSTAGTQRFVVDSSGNAGLGVTPSAWSGFTALQIDARGSLVSGAGVTDINMNVGGSAETYLQNATAMRYRMQSGQHQWHTAASGIAGNSITFTQAMTLTADAQLGIGTTSPSHPLQVRRAGGACSLGLNLDNYGAIAELARSVFYYAIGDSTTDKTGHLFFTRDATATDNLRVVINSSGRVGINVSEPSTTFNVGDKSHGIGIAYINSSTLSSVAGVYTTSSGWGYGYGDLILKARTDYGGFYNIIFSTASSDNTPVERARITSGGNLLVGSTSTPTPLNAISGIAAAKLLTATDGSTPTQASSIVIFGGSTGSPNAGRVFFGDNTGWEWEWGYVNSTNTYGRRFYFTDGGAAYSSTGTWGTISDESLKQDISDSGSQWNDIKSIKFRRYRFKKDVLENENAPFMLGVVAQEVEQTSTGLVYTSKNGEKSVKTSILLMKAAVALQEAMARIEVLEADMAVLKGSN